MKTPAEITRIAIAALEDVKGSNIEVLDVSSLTSITDHMIICTGTSSRHVKALADSVMDKAREAGIRPLSSQGFEAGDWGLVDLNGTIVHIMLATARATYQLEKLWDMGQPKPQLGEPKSVRKASAKAAKKPAAKPLAKAVVKAPAKKAPAKKAAAKKAPAKAAPAKKALVKAAVKVPAKKPAASKPVSKASPAKPAAKPVLAKPAAKKPVAKAAAKPVAKKPVVKKTVVKAAAKPVVKKAAAKAKKR